MQVAVTGSTGLVGSALVERLRSKGDSVVRLVRSPGDASGEDVLWDPGTGTFQAERLEGLDAVVHLAGEPIDQRWGKATRKRIRESRVTGTGLLVDGLLTLEDPPGTLVSASAVGYYGDRGDEVLDESQPPGANFVAEVCRAWEDATVPAREAGIRVVNTRFGIILSPEGGALAKMLLPFKLGVGGRVGPGDQWYSWITRDDAARVIIKALTDEDLQGPVNTCTPAPVTNKRFTKALGGALGRPTVFPIPGAALRLLYGRMADELLLASARMEPAKLEKVGFEFEHPGIDEALETLVG